jgi:hypothetical protein
LAVNAYLLFILGRWPELDEAIDERKYGVISPQTYVISGENARSPLSNDNSARAHLLATVSLDPKPL